MSHFSDGGTRVVDGETLAGWGVISRSHHGRIDIMFGPVITTEAHLAFSGARTRSNNTAEMTAMIEALSFLGPHGPVTRDDQSCFCFDSKHAAGVLSGHDPSPHTCAAGASMSTIYDQSNTCYGSPCNTCMVTVEIWVVMC